MINKVKLIIGEKTNKATGMSRYAETLSESLGNNAETVEAIINIPKIVKKTFGALGVDLKTILNNFPPYIKTTDTESIWHFTNQQQTILLNYKKPKKCIVTVLDIIPLASEFQEKPGFIRMLYSLAMRNIKRADAILAISEYTKKDVVEKMKIEKDKIFVVPLAADKEFKPLNVPKNDDIKQILYVGSEIPRKNLPVLIHAFSMISKKYKNVRLKKVGVSQNEKARNDLLDLSRKLGVLDKIDFPNHIDSLVEVYNSADVFVFPSKYEGFGLPVLEAMACGCPVITTNLTSIPEVAGDASLYFDPDSPEELAEQIERVLFDKDLSQKLTDQGIKRADKFSWDRVAKETIDVYKTF